MKQTILFSTLILSFIVSTAQKEPPPTLLRKIPAVYDSLSLTKERKKTLETSRNTANRDHKNIMVFTARTKNTKEQDVLFIGKLEKKEVFRVDLRLVVSKYIGETEKNLNQVFADAERKNAILFFDDADALFSRDKQQEATANYIETLANIKKVITIFWCEDDCLKWLKRGRYVLVE